MGEMSRAALKKEEARGRKSEAFVKVLREQYSDKVVSTMYVGRNDLNGEHELFINFTDRSQVVIATAETRGKPFACRLLVNGVDYENPGSAR